MYASSTQGWQLFLSWSHNWALRFNSSSIRSLCQPYFRSLRMRKSWKWRHRPSPASTTLSKASFRRTPWTWLKTRRAAIFCMLTLMICPSSLSRTWLWALMQATSHYKSKWWTSSMFQPRCSRSISRSTSIRSCLWWRRFLHRLRAPPRNRRIWEQGRLSQSASSLPQCRNRRSSLIASNWWPRSSSSFSMASLSRMILRNLPSKIPLPRYRSSSKRSSMKTRMPKSS